MIGCLVESPDFARPGAYAKIRWANSHGLGTGDSTRTVAAIRPDATLIVGRESSCDRLQRSPKGWG